MCRADVFNVVRCRMGNLNAGESAGAEIERLAELVAQLANEGDASVAAVRKRLLEGGRVPAVVASR